MDKYELLLSDIGTPLDTGQSSAESTIRYFDIAWISRCDGPGHRVVLYLQGCHLDCIWCHSPHSQPAVAPILFFAARCCFCGRCEQACPNSVHKCSSQGHILNRERCTGCGRCVEACPVSSSERTGGSLSLPTRELAVDDLWDLLWPQLTFLRDIGGITVSGGEPLLQSHALRALFDLCCETGIHTAVETSGALPPEHLTEIAGQVDTWLFGLRPSPSYQPPGSEFIQNNLAYLSNLGSHVIIRTPIVAGITDQSKSLNSIAATMRTHGLKEIELLPFHAGTFHYYNALGMPCPVGRECIPSVDRLDAVCNFFIKEGFEARIIH